MIPLKNHSQVSLRGIPPWRDDEAISKLPTEKRDCHEPRWVGALAMTVKK
ncbi:MAG: hypothetical protein V1833_05965 [Elusimicrobiota bacterium]